MRVLIPRAGVAVGTRVTLDDNEVHHLRVRRARDQEPVELLDGAGLSGRGRLIHSGSDWSVEIESLEHEQAPAELTLAVAAGDRDRFIWMAEKSVELGVTTLVPLLTTHTAAVATRLKESHLLRLRRSMLEVLKQCGSAWAPTLEDPVALRSFLQQKRPGVRWLADRAGETVPFQLDSSPLTIVVGPEGGLTEAERAHIIAAGYSPVALGPHTLRFETAAVAALAAAGQARLRGRSHG